MRAWSLVLVVGLVGCNADPDGDGLGNRDERVWGSDKKVADSDGDGLSDGEEVELGTHPMMADTDEDGALDGEEIRLGLNPLDPNSRPYLGGWPMLPEDEKAPLARGTRGQSRSKVGEAFRRFKLFDQFGDKVDIYDFAKGGRPIIVDVSAEWCGPCNAMAAWLDGEGESFNGLGPEVRDAVNNGDVVWLTVLGEDDQGNDATKATAKRWYREYKNPNVPVLAAGSDFPEYIGLGFWPTLFTLDEDMVMTSFDDYQAIIDACAD